MKGHTRVDNMPEYILEVNKILHSIYDNPKAFAIRDRDRSQKEKLEWYSGINKSLLDQNIKDNMVKIFEFQCYAVENLCFTDEFLFFWGIKWSDLKDEGAFFKRADRGINKNCKSEQAKLMSFLYKKEEEKESKGEKNIKRMSWQEAVARVITNTIRDFKKNPYVPSGEHSILIYLGNNILTELFEFNSFVFMENKENWGELSTREISKYAFKLFDTNTLKKVSCTSKNSYIISKEIEREREEKITLSSSKK